MRKWVLYVFLLGFAAYWASNLILWFPWSYSATLGITLMLTVTPLLWAYTTYWSLATYPGENAVQCVSVIASVFLLVAIIFDYVFFAIIRGALEDLYHPTTFYGYGFLVFWPIILSVIFQKRLSKKAVGRSKLVYSSITGVSCVTMITLIIIFDIKL